MTTDSEERVRTLLNAAAPDPSRTFDGAALREAADEPDVLFLRARSRSTSLSVVLAVAAVVVVALVVVGLVARSGDGSKAPTGAHHRHAPPVATGPAACGDTLVLVAGRFVGPSEGNGTVTLTIRNAEHELCTATDLPSIRLTFDRVVVSALPAARYQPTRPVVVGPYRPAHIVVALHRANRCVGLGPGKTQLAFALDGATYAVDLPIAGCEYLITSALVHQP